MNDRNNFVTFFSKDYSIYGLTLIDSILKVDPNANIFVFPLDFESKMVTEEKMYPSNRIKVLRDDKILDEIGINRERGRSKSEAIFGVKPQIIKCALEEIEEGAYIYYCDADLFFFRKLQERNAEAEVILSEHQFRKDLISYKKYGQFNAGFVGFKKNVNGISALNWWIEKCQEKCSMVPDRNSFADQKYLESLVNSKYATEIISIAGFNQSLWTFDKELKINPGPSFNDKAIINYHFHGLRAYKKFVKTDLARYGRISQEYELFVYIYRPYLQALAVNLPLTKKYLLEQSLNLIQRLKKREYVWWKLL